MGNRRHRDRHGRGLRSSLFRADVPARLDRAKGFTREASSEFARLKTAEPQLLANVVLAVDLVPPATSDEPAFGRVFPQSAHRPPHIVLYRRTIEDHSGPDQRPALIAEVLADQVEFLRNLS